MRRTNTIRIVAALVLFGAVAVFATVLVFHAKTEAPTTNEAEVEAEYAETVRQANTEGIAAVAEAHEQEPTDQGEADGPFDTPNPDDPDIPGLQCVVKS